MAETDIVPKGHLSGFVVRHRRGIDSGTQWTFGLLVITIRSRRPKLTGDSGRWTFITLPMWKWGFDICWQGGAWRFE